MRAIDRDLIRGGHYGQRPRVPHTQAEHMGAPTNAANVKKVLANSEPSTHGGKADIRIVALSSRRLAQNVNGNCRQNKRRHGDERDER
jgi:hypothetical protein